MIRLVQLQHPEHGRAVAIVDEPHLRVLENHGSIYGLAAECIAADRTLADALKSARQQPTPLNYDEVYSGKSAWTLLPCFDHPSNPTRCFVTGTGLTHKASARKPPVRHARRHASSSPTA